MDDFTLWERVYRDDELIAQVKIAETKPREMLFLDYFRHFIGGSLSFVFPAHT
jgi:hypothetical protein